jgi:pimeloyl-ACP methyl ester carboxylesterase
MSALRQPIRIATGESVRTAYRQTGSGPLLLLIHGAEADHTMFLGLMEALAKDFSVVAYDQRDSGSTENGSEPYDLETLAGDAARLINFLLEASGRSSVHI